MVGSSVTDFAAIKAAMQRLEGSGEVQPSKGEVSASAEEIESEARELFYRGVNFWRILRRAPATTEWKRLSANSQEWYRMMAEDVLSRRA